MGLNRQGVSFQDAVIALSTSIASNYPLVGMKGRKALVSETNTGGLPVSLKSHLNGVSFTAQDWKRHFKPDDFKCIPIQVKRLIGFAKNHNYDEKNAAFVQESKDRKDNKRGRQASETRSHSDDPDDAIVDRAISKIAKAFQSYKGDNASNEDNDATDDDTKPRSGAGATFGKGKNQFVGKRG